MDQNLTRLVVAAAVVVVALVISSVIRRRRATDPPTQVTRSVPSQLDRADFPEADTAWLVAVFTSSTCSTCADVVAKSRVLESEEVTVVDIEYTARRDLHQRYAIDAVPTLVVADTAGEVRSAFLGPVTATDLWAAVAECREPGSVRAPGESCSRDTGAV